LGAFNTTRERGIGKRKNPKSKREVPNKGPTETGGGKTPIGNHEQVGGFGKNGKGVKKKENYDSGESGFK